MNIGVVSAVPPVWAGVAVGLAALLLRGVALRRGRRDRDRLIEGPLLRRLLPMPPPAQGPLGAILFAAGVGAIAAAAAGTGAAGPNRGDLGGPETVLVLDASNSMLVEDVRPSRLARQRELAQDLASRLTGPVAVVYFAGRGYVLSPLTLDRGAVSMYVEAVRPANVGWGGSALAAGLSQALGVLAGGDPDARRAVVLFSDGEETAGQGLDDALELAVRAGVRVHAVGIGTPEGGQIPLGPDAAFSPALPSDLPAGAPELERGGYLRGPDGEVVVSRLEEGVLRQIAEATGGMYLPDSTDGLADVAARLMASAGPTGGSGPGGGAGGWLLLAGFCLLWTEAFLFRR